MKTAIYLRKSRKEEGNPDTLRKHRETLLSYAEEHHLDVTGVYEEVVSGETLFLRPQILQLLADMDAGNFSAVLCMDIDRLGRGSMSSQGIILETFKNNNCKIITPRHIYDLDNEFDEQFSEFEAFLARQEYKIINRRLRRGILHTVEKGGYVSEVPFGYRRVFLEKLPTLEIDPIPARYVQLAFQMYADGIKSREIADFFTQSGLRPKKSQNGWNKNTILHILKNPVYLGDVHYNRTRKIKKAGGQPHYRYVPNPESKHIFFPHAHPPIVSQALFDSVQAFFQKQSHSARPLQNPFNGLIVCGKCGKKLLRLKGAAPDGDRLICPTAGCCKSILLKALEDIVLAHLDDILGNFQVNPGTLPEKQAIQQQRRMLETQIQSVHMAFEQHIYDAETFSARLSSLQDQKETLNKLLPPAVAKDFMTFSKLYRRKDSVMYKNALLSACLTQITYQHPKDTPGKIFLKFTFSDL